MIVLILIIMILERYNNKWFILWGSLKLSISLSQIWFICLWYVCFPHSDIMYFRVSFGQHFTLRLEDSFQYIFMDKVSMTQLQTKYSDLSPTILIQYFITADCKIYLHFDVALVHCSYHCSFRLCRICKFTSLKKDRQNEHV